LKILDLLKMDFVLPDLKARDRKGVFEEMADVVAPELGVESEELVKALLDRESTRPTALERTGVAIPHARFPNIKKFVVLFGRSVEGIDFRAEDSRPSHLFFLIVGPEDAPGDYLRLLAHIARLCHNEKFRQKLVKSSDKQSIIDVISDQDEKY